MATLLFDIQGVFLKLQPQLTIKPSFLDRFSISLALFLHNYWHNMENKSKTSDAFVYTGVYACEDFDEKRIFRVLQKLPKSPKERYEAFKDNLTKKKTNN